MARRRPGFPSLGAVVFGFALFCLPRRPARAQNAGRGLRRVDGVLDLVPGGLLLVGRNFRPALIIKSHLLITGAVISAVGNAFLHADVGAIIGRSGECRLHSGESVEAREAEGSDENFAHFQFPWFAVAVHMLSVRGINSRMQLFESSCERCVSASIGAKHKRARMNRG